MAHDGQSSELRLWRRTLTEKLGDQKGETTMRERNVAGAGVTAKMRAEGHVAAIKAQLEKIQSAVETIDALEDIHWGHVGTLQMVRDTLGETLSSLWTVHAVREGSR